LEIAVIIALFASTESWSAFDAAVYPATAAVPFWHVRISYAANTEVMWNADVFVLFSRILLSPASFLLPETHVPGL